jgi:hypothetical protein
MANDKIDLKTCSLSLSDAGIIQLHIYHDEVLEPTKVREIFDVIHSKLPKGKGLLVTAGNKATLSPEARELASSEDITDQIKADAIVTEHYSHQMSANFFVRYNQPNRPTQLFKTEEEAREWLREQI